MGYTKTKSREAHIDPGSPPRREEPGVGPGHYEAVYTLTHEKKREAHIDPSSPLRQQQPGVGPGSYEVNLSLTKDKHREAHIDPGNSAIKYMDHRGGPGTYEEHRTFEKDTVQYTIG